MKNNYSKMNQLSFFYVLGLMLALGLLAGACRPENPFPIPPDFDEILVCHEQENGDSLSLRQAMVGQWDWYYLRCEGEPDDFPSGTGGTYLDIKADSMGLWPENSLDPIIVSAWNLERRNASLFVLRTEPLLAAPDLDAQVLVCGEWLVFNRSYRDLCDIYYRKRQ